MDIRKIVCEMFNVLCGNWGLYIFDDDLYMILVYLKMGFMEYVSVEIYIIRMIIRECFCVIIIFKGLIIEKYLCIFMVVSVKMDEVN